jgi:hypothetical protein
MAEPPRAASAPPPLSLEPAKDTNMTKLYVGVIIVEAIVLAGLYWLQRVYS